MTEKIELALDAVSVLTDGAILTHKGKLKLEKGEQVITITKLSEYLDQDSVRVKGKGKVVLVDVAPKMEYIRFEDQEMDELEEEIKELEKQIKEKQSEKEILEYTINTLSDTVKEIGLGFGEWGLIKELKAEDLDTYFTYYKKEAIEERKEIIKITREIVELNKKIEILQAKKNQIRSSDKRFYEVDITLEMKVEGEIELELAYTINKGKWDPMYIVELTKEGASIQRQARIYNTSGFDWENVDVTVSTANRAPLRIQELNPFYISLKPLPKLSDYQAPAGPPSRPKMKRAMAPTAGAPPPMEAKKELAAEPAPAPMEVRESQVSMSQTGHQRFELAGKHTVPSGKDPKTLQLDSFELEFEKIYHWNSSQAKLILTHEIKNKDYFLLPGIAKIFIDGEYISQTHLNLIHPKEKFTLGVIESFDIKVEKKLVLREVSKKGIVRGKRQMDFGYKIEMENQIDKECKITIVDRIPHSKSEDVSVELNNISIEPDKRELGVFEWELSLVKDEEKEITYDYSVSFPQDRELRPPL